MLNENPESAARISIDFEPVGRRTDVERGMTVLSTAQGTGIRIHLVRGGVGSCDSFRIRHVSGELSGLTLVEGNALSDDRAHR